MRLVGVFKNALGALAERDLRVTEEGGLIVTPTVVDAAGELVAPDSWPQSIVRNGDGTINYIETTDGASTWRQTWTYTNGLVTGISAWVKQ